MKIISIFLSLLALTTYGQDIPITSKTIAMNKQSVVPLLCLPADTKELPAEPEILGSGFFINDQGDFLIARHAFEDLKRELKNTPKCHAAIFFPVGGWTLDKPSPKIFVFPFKDCIKSTHYDVAVCHPETNPFEIKELKNQLSFVTFGPSAGKPEGTPIAITGFPLRLTRPVASTGIIAAFLDQEQALLINGMAWPGSSGSPVFIGDGSVIGMLVASFRQSPGLSVVLHSEDIINFLKTTQVPFSQKEKPRTPPKPAATLTRSKKLSG